MKPTVPRPKPNFRQLLQDHPGWYMNRHGMGTFHSGDMLQSSKRFMLWRKAEWVEYGGRFQIMVNWGDDQWYFCGNGKEP